MKPKEMLLRIGKGERGQNQPGLNGGYCLDQAGGTDGGLDRVGPVEQTEMALPAGPLMEMGHGGDEAEAQEGRQQGNGEKTASVILSFQISMLRS